VSSAAFDDNSNSTLDCGSGSQSSRPPTCSSISSSSSSCSTLDDRDDDVDDDDESWKDAWSAMLYRNKVPRKRIVIVD